MGEHHSFKLVEANSAVAVEVKQWLEIEVFQACAILCNDQIEQGQGDEEGVCGKLDMLGTIPLKEDTQESFVVTLEARQ